MNKKCPQRRVAAPRSVIHRPGVVLVIVLIVIAVLSLAAYSFSEMMVTQTESVQVGGHLIQSQALAASGVESLRAFMMMDEATRLEAGGILDNPGEFQAINVLPDEDPQWRGNFTIVATALDEEGVPVGIRYGLENESARININAIIEIEEQAAAIGLENVARDMLMSLPGMSEEIADAILDWVDADDEPREFGAELDYYEGMDPPYWPKNGPLETVEELLLVRDVTPELLFGADVNRNGMVDANEAAVSGAAAQDAESLSRGWSAYFTLFSKEANVNADGQPRVDINNDNLEQLREDLEAALVPEEWIVFIIAYRQNGWYSGDDDGEKYSGGKLDLTVEGSNKFTQVLDLIDKKVEVEFTDAEDSVVLNSPFGKELVAMATYMPVLMDKLTIVQGESIPGRVNLRDAPAETLIGIPGMTEEIVSEILDQRTIEPDPNDKNAMHETWLLTNGVVTLEEMRALSPFICMGGDVYRAQVIGYYESGRAASRVEIVLDATQVPPRLLLWRDISHLGRGYPLETLGAGALEDF